MLTDCPHWQTFVAFDRPSAFPRARKPFHNPYRRHDEPIATSALRPNKWNPLAFITRVVQYTNEYHVKPDHHHSNDWIPDMKNNITNYFVFCFAIVKFICFLCWPMFASLPKLRNVYGNDVVLLGFLNISIVFYLFSIFFYVFYIKKSGDNKRYLKMCIWTKSLSWHKLRRLSQETWLSQDHNPR